MRIARARIVPYGLTLRRPLVVAAGSISVRIGCLLRVEAEDGTVGWGDAAPLAGYTVDAPQPVRDRLEAVAVAMAGRDSTEVESLVDRRRFPSVVSAITGAVADLEAATAGTPLAGYLAPGAPAAAVPVHALVSGRSPEEVAAAGRAALESGYRACKLKVGGRTTEDDIDRIAALRRAVGPEPALRLDANGSWSRDEAAAVLEAVAPLGIDYVEDPVADWGAMGELRDRFDISLAADQLLRSEDDVAIAAAVAAVAVVKPSAVGGPRHALDLARAADDAGLQVVFGSLLESAVGLTAAIHVAAAWGRPDTVSGLATSSMFRADVAEAPGMVDGRVRVPTGPGLGIEVVEGEASQGAATDLPQGGAR